MYHPKFYMLACSEYPCADNLLKFNKNPHIFNSPDEASEFLNKEPHVVAGGYTYLVECRVVAGAPPQFKFQEWYHD